MIRHTFFHRGGLFAVACLIAIATVSVAHAALPSRLAPVCDPRDVNSFIAAIRVLDPSYNPNVPPGRYQPPDQSATQFDPGKNANITADLTNAFTNAPYFLRYHLCNSNGVYISTSGCASWDPSKYVCTPPGAWTMFNGSWGFRSHAPNASDFGYSYVAVSAADLWQGGGPAPALHDYETDILLSYSPAASPPGFTANTKPDSSYLSVMAALAHEAGHVLWAQKLIPNVNGSYDFSPLTQCFYGDFFSGWAYNSVQQLKPKGRWRKFHDRGNEGNSKLDHSAPPYLSDLDNPSTANTALYQLYQSSQPWASLFGAQTADEDFVETYVMAALTGFDPNSKLFAGPLASMPLSVPGAAGPPPDIPADLRAGNKPALYNKIACLPM